MCYVYNMYRTYDLCRMGCTCHIHIYWGNIREERIFFMCCKHTENVQQSKHFGNLNLLDNIYNQNVLLYCHSCKIYNWTFTILGCRYVSQSDIPKKIWLQIIFIFGCILAWWIGISDGWKFFHFSFTWPYIWVLGYAMAKHYNGLHLSRLRYFDLWHFIPSILNVWFVE